MAAGQSNATLGHMLRLVSFFVVVFFTYRVLSIVPVVGPLLSRLGFIGYWLVAILVSVLIARGGQYFLQRAQLRRRMDALGAVKTPNTEGKLGLLLLQAGCRRKALPHLEAAFLGQPELIDWAFGLGRIHLALGEPAKAGRYFARVVTDDPEHGFGEAYIGLAKAALSLSRPLDALEALLAHDRYHGKNPEALFLRGRALKASGQEEAAKLAFGEVLQMGKDLPKSQRKGYFRLACLALVSRW